MFTVNISSSYFQLLIPGTKNHNFEFEAEKEHLIESYYFVF